RRHGEGQRHLHRAARLMESAQEQLRGSKLELKSVTPAGDFRRGCELVSNLALVVETSELEGEPRKLVSNSQLNIFVTDKRRAGATLLLATGTEKHVEELRALAAKCGMTLNEQGLLAGNKVVASGSEEAIYAALGLPFIEPELQEGRGEIELAQRGKLPKLIIDTHTPTHRTAATLWK